jgi:hypothetical protein
MLLGVGFDSHCDIWWDYNITPIATDEAAGAVELLPAGDVGCEGAVGLGVGAEALLEGEAGQSPLFVVVEVDDGGWFCEEHVVVPVD